jgi:hypothetical protein
MAHHIFQLENELQNIPEAAPETSRSFAVSEKLARYGSSALTGAEHLTLLVGKKSVASASAPLLLPEDDTSSYNESRLQYSNTAKN